MVGAIVAHLPGYGFVSLASSWSIVQGPVCATGTKVLARFQDWHLQTKYIILT